MGLLINIKLQNFRNYSDAKWDFGKVNAIIGRNGTGKTNILEAMRYLSLLKSFRARKEEEVVLFNQRMAILEANIKNNGKNKIIITIEKDKKACSINKKTVKLSEAVGVLKSVLFCPEDILIIDGAPSVRRRYLDQLISQKDKKYLKGLINYNRILAIRNALLGRIADGLAREDELDVWDEQIIAPAKYISQRREEVIEELSKISEGYLNEMDGNFGFSMEYQRSESSIENLIKSRRRDIVYQITHIGAQRDDILIYLNNRALAQFGSRGQKRMVLLSLKQAEIDYLTEEERPLLLLDDVFSELDREHQEKINKIITKQQTILTTTNLPESIKKMCDEVIELNE